MRFNIPENSITYPELQEKLQQRFPDYEFKMRGPKLLVASTSKTCGANIMIRKKKVSVFGAFPTMGGQMLFAVCIVLLGVIIPMIVYLAAFQGKMKNLENEIGNYIKDELVEI